MELGERREQKGESKEQEREKKFLQLLEKENHWRIQVRLFAENSKEKCNKERGRKEKEICIHSLNAVYKGLCRVFVNIQHFFSLPFQRGVENLQIQYPASPFILMPSSSQKDWSLGFHFCL